MVAIYNNNANIYMHLDIVNVGKKGSHMHPKSGLDLFSVRVLVSYMRNTNHSQNPILVYPK
jgi:hypothetical protein